MIKSKVLTAGEIERSEHYGIDPDQIIDIGPERIVFEGVSRCRTEYWRVFYREPTQ